MRGRGIAFEGRAALRAWLLANIGYLLGSVLLIVACVCAAQGLPIGFLLLFTWSIVDLLHGAASFVFVPAVMEQGESLLYLFPVAVVAVLRQPEVRSYLSRSDRAAEKFATV